MSSARGGHSVHMHMGVCQRNFLATQKYQFRLSLLPKNITYFYALTTVNEHKNPVTMPIEARIASTEPRDISLTMLYATKNIMAMISVILDSKNHFWKYSDQEISDLPPFMFRVPHPLPPWGAVSHKKNMRI